MAKFTSTQGMAAFVAATDWAKDFHKSPFGEQESKSGMKIGRLSRLRNGKNPVIWEDVLQMEKTFPGFQAQFEKALAEGDAPTVPGLKELSAKIDLLLKKVDALEVEVVQKERKQTKQILNE